MKFFVFVFFPLISFAQADHNYKNLVLEGGGVRGFAYPGALQVLEKNGIFNKIENVAGTSSGAISVLMIALGYSSMEITSELDKLKLNKFKDGWIFGIAHRVKKEYGVFKGERFEKWLGQLIKNKTGNEELTFLQLHEMHLKNNTYKDIFCTGTNISRQRIQVFSWQNTPGMQIKTAVHASSCLPLYFKPVAVDSTWKKVSIKKNKNPFDLYIDGGLIANYPINIFDTCIFGGDPLTCGNVKYNNQTLGLKLEREEQLKQFNNNVTDVAGYKIRSLNDYLEAVLNEMMETLARKTPDLSNEKGRTIYISHGMLSGKLKHISSDTKKALFNNGVAAAEKFFTLQHQ